MPGKQPILRQGVCAVRGGVEHHVDDAFGMSIDRCKRADVDAQTTGNRGAHGFGVERLALDFAGFEHVLGQCDEARLVSQNQADVSQPAGQMALRMADACQWFGQRGEVVAPVRPVGGLPDVTDSSRFMRRLSRLISAKARLFDAFFAEKNGSYSPQAVFALIPSGRAAPDQGIA